MDLLPLPLHSMHNVFCPNRDPHRRLRVQQCVMEHLIQVDLKRAAYFFIYSNFSSMEDVEKIPFRQQIDAKGHIRPDLEGQLIS
jgi:hypothetical protein